MQKNQTQLLTQRYTCCKGVTLIELTVVIAVILLLISILIISANYYIKSSHRSACVVNISTIQKSVRAHQNINDLSFGDSFQLNEIIGVGKPLTVAPTCPQEQGSYIMLVNQIPDYGQTAVVCSDFDSTLGTVDPSQEHNPRVTPSW